MSLTKFLIKASHESYGTGSIFNLKVMPLLAPPSEGQYYHSKHLWARKAIKVCPVVSSSKSRVLIPAGKSDFFAISHFEESEEGHGSQLGSIRSKQIVRWQHLSR